MHLEVMTCTCFFLCLCDCIENQCFPYTCIDHLFFRFKIVHFPFQIFFFTKSISPPEF